jgi:hypothetical protein
MDGMFRPAKAASEVELPAAEVQPGSLWNRLRKKIKAVLGGGQTASAAASSIDRDTVNTEIIGPHTLSADMSDSGDVLEKLSKLEREGYRFSNAEYRGAAIILECTDDTYILEIVEIVISMGGEFPPDHHLQFRSDAPHIQAACRLIADSQQDQPADPDRTFEENIKSSLGDLSPEERSLIATLPDDPITTAVKVTAPEGFKVDPVVTAVGLGFLPKARLAPKAFGQKL